MKKIIILFLFLGLISCNSGIEGEGPAIGEQAFEAGDFSELSVACNCDLTLIPAETTKIVVESHQNLIDNIRINSKRKKLIISENVKVKDYSLYNVNVYFNPNLTSIKLEDHSKMKVSGTLKSDKMNLILTDDSKINNSFVDTRKLNLTLNDNSTATISGNSIDVEIQITDDSKADLTDLNAVNINFKSTGQSELRVNPMKSLSGSAEDQSVVRYKGDPDKKTTLKDRASIEKIK